MRDATVRHYADMSDRLDQQREHGWGTYGGSLASLRAYRGHHPQAHTEYRQVDGRWYWMTRKMARILAIAQRQSNRTNRTTSITLIAREARVTQGYASKVLRRLTGWGFIGSATSRGRYGGIMIWKIKKAVDRARRVLSSVNHSSVLQGRGSKDIYGGMIEPWDLSEEALR